MINNALTLLEELTCLLWISCWILMGCFSAAVGPCRGESPGDRRSSWGPAGLAWVGAFERVSKTNLSVTEAYEIMIHRYVFILNQSPEAVQL